MKRELDNELLIFGIFFGLLVGGLATLLKAPKSGIAFRSEVNEAGQSLRATIQAAVPSDPVAESMAEGKAAARRRLTELGQN